MQTPPHIRVHRAIERLKFAGILILVGAGIAAICGDEAAKIAIVVVFLIWLWRWNAKRQLRWL